MGGDVGQALRKRVQTGREEQKKQRQLDLERLLQRYQVRPSVLFFLSSFSFRFFFFVVLPRCLALLHSPQARMCSNMSLDFGPTEAVVALLLMMMFWCGGQNVKSELESQQNIERIRAEKFMNYHLSSKAGFPGANRQQSAGSLGN